MDDFFGRDVRCTLPFAEGMNTRGPIESRSSTEAAPCIKVSISKLLSLDHLAAMAEVHKSIGGY
jgi:hypothetical protein